MASKKDKVYFVVVDEFVENPETGALKLRKPVYRDHVFYTNKPAFTGPDGVFHPATAKKLVPDKYSGLYIVNAAHDPEASKAMAIMKAKVDDPANPIIGPFETFEEAIAAKEDARTRTPRENVSQLTQANAEATAEIEALKAELAKIQKGAKQ